MAKAVYARFDCMSFNLYCSELDIGDDTVTAAVDKSPGSRKVRRYVIINVKSRRFGWLGLGKSSALVY